MTREQLAQVWPQLLEHGVQWRDGMAGTFTPRGNTWRAVNCLGDTWSYQFSWSTARRPKAAQRRNALPDLEDPATVGCLLAEAVRLVEPEILVTNLLVKYGTHDDAGVALVQLLAWHLVVEWPD